MVVVFAVLASVSGTLAVTPAGADIPRHYAVAPHLATIEHGRQVRRRRHRLKPKHSGRHVHRHRPKLEPSRRRLAHASTAGKRTPTGTGLSGEPMPTGDIPGWHQVLADDFNGSSLDSSRWRTYSGQPGGDPGGWFDPHHVSVSNGRLVISGYKDAADGGKWATGGVSNSPGLVQTYGKYLVRFRFDSGVGIAHVILLWPADNAWPPEVDLSEDNGASRQTDWATLHYGSDNTQIPNKLAVDLTQWHTLGVEWTKGRLVYTIDGRRWATLTGSQVPAVPMVLDIQTQAWACGTSTWEQCPNATTPRHVNLSVDWAVAYAPDAGS